MKQNAISDFIIFRIDMNPEFQEEPDLILDNYSITEYIDDVLEEVI